MRNHRPRRYHGSRNSGRGFKRNNGRSENDFLRNGLNSEMNHRRSFRGNQNAHKLQEKYLNLAKEALSSGDIILSENYFQHADHFSRIVESKKEISSNAISTEKDKDIVKENSNVQKPDIEKQTLNEGEINKKD